MQPLVSILIPAYRAAPWIAATLRSALGQTWSNKEIIVVDDGSPDETFEIAKGFAGPRVQVVMQRNAGASSARNWAFELAQGDYVQWLDADDLLAPDKVARQMQTSAEIGDSRMLLSSPFATFMHRLSKAAFHPTALWNDLSPLEWLLRKMGQNLHMQTSTWLVSRELTQAAGPWDTRISLDDDGEYFCRVLLASSGVRFVPGASVFYRASGPTRMSNVDMSNKKLESQFLSMQLHVQYLRSLEDSERVRQACRYYLQTWLPYFVPERMDLVAQLREMARALGGELENPGIRPKYAPVARIFGYPTAKRAQNSVSRLKWAAVRRWDKLMALGERGQKGYASPSS